MDAARPAEARPLRELAHAVADQDRLEMAQLAAFEAGEDGWWTRTLPPQEDEWEDEPGGDDGMGEEEPDEEPGREEPEGGGAGAGAPVRTRAAPASPCRARA